MWEMDGSKDLVLLCVLVSFKLVIGHRPFQPPNIIRCVQLEYKGEEGLAMVWFS